MLFKIFSATRPSLVRFILIFLFSVHAFAVGEIKHVFIISIDGGNPEILMKSDMPTLRRLMNSYSVTLQAKTVNPNITLPSHTSMLTGVDPKTHGITWNNWIPSRGVVKFPTVFKKAKQAGLITALFAGKDKFNHLNQKDSFDNFSILDKKASVVASSAATYIETFKPNLCFIHLPDVDTAGHDSGWGSIAQRAAFKEVDSSIERLLKSIENSFDMAQTVVIITADHGGKGRNHNSVEAANWTIPWVAVGGFAKKNYSIIEKVSTLDTAATALWLLDLPITGIQGKAVVSAFENY